MRTLRDLAFIAAVVLAFTLFVIWAHSVDFGLFSFFAPKYEAVRRQTFEQSQSYNEGMLRDLENIRTEYLDPSKTPAQRAALRATAMHRFEVFPESHMTPDLAAFYHQLQNEQ